MARLFIPVGIPGCGKSTYAERVLDSDNLKVLETDAIRAEMVEEGLLESVSDMSKNEAVFDRFHLDISEALTSDYDVYADATNLRDFARQRLRVLAEEDGAETVLLFFHNVTQAVSRNVKRERVVPADVMVRMLEQYEKARRDIPQEQYTIVINIESIS